VHCPRSDASREEEDETLRGVEKNWSRENLPDNEARRNSLETLSARDDERDDESTTKEGVIRRVRCVAYVVTQERVIFLRF